MPALARNHPRCPSRSLASRLLLAWIALACGGGLAAPCLHGQIVAEEKTPDLAAPRFGEPDVIRFRVGAEITASRGACRNILAMVTVPLECPEQQVELVDEDFSPEIEQVTYRLLQGGANQMLISIRFLPDGATAHAFVTAEVSTRPILPPEKTDDLKIPKRLPAKLRSYTSGSPYIETKHRSIRDLAKEIWKEIDPSATDWERVEAIYDHVLENIKYVEGPDKGALETLRDEQADCQGRSALFIALCRANDIPARMVWVDGHCFPEFYLEHAEGEGHWYPCESAGTRAFGEMPLARTVLQKGDNFRVPERNDRLRYASDFLIGVPTPGGGRPKVTYIRQQLETISRQPSDVDDQPSDPK
ncbi:MAG: transglutaminase-like domain-containing protein [Planctomycetes bacterium]|nr:transglutaminase-like domain-containing protein [Planctomycetota bacterium]